MSPKRAAANRMAAMGGGDRRTGSSDLAQRAGAMAGDNSAVLGATANYPLPGVIALIRVEAQAWNRDAQGNLSKGATESARCTCPIRTRYR